MRDHNVHERASTPLELLFDLCFVVAVAFLAAELHHGIADGHPLSAAATYLLLFIPVWWAWMSYTWFATAFSHDDPLTRLLTLLQMGGVLAVAATVPQATVGRVLPFAFAYALMRLPLILQWLRAARADAAHRGFALTYAVGSVAAQLIWIAGSLADPPGRFAWYVVALGLELATPVLAVGRAPGRVFHPGHIAERYGLFTIIVLGETILAVAVGFRDVLDGDGAVGSAAVVVAVALVIAFGLWWIYFDALGRDGLTRNRKAAFVWGYGHYLLFAAVAAIGAGVQAQLDGDDGGGLTGVAAVAPVSLAVAVSLAVIAWLQVAANQRRAQAGWLWGGVAACLLITAGSSLLTVGIADSLVAGVVVGLVVREVFHQPLDRARSVSTTERGGPADG